MSVPSEGQQIERGHVIARNFLPWPKSMLQFVAVIFQRARPQAAISATVFDVTGKLVTVDRNARIAISV